MGSFPVSTQNQAKQKLVPWATPEKSEHWAYGPVLAFPCQGKSGGWVFPFHCMMLCWELRGVRREEIMVRECLGFSYQLRCIWFHACPGCRSLSVGFWICHSGICLVYCCSITAHGRRRVENFLFFPLIDITTLEHNFFSYLSVFVHLVPSVGKETLPFLSNIQIPFRTML